MDPREVKAAILNFILDSVDPVAFIEGDSFPQYGDYKDFVEDQTRILEVVPVAQLERYRVTMIDITNGMLEVAPKRRIQGFYLREGRVVYTL